ncbi:MAG TPA: hypothetical protein VK892_14445 [Pyrinomonadaceae bacterium]|nr:hypothetical protein [Pyrinomonadaceae bacterium]
MNNNDNLEQEFKDNSEEKTSGESPAFPDNNSQKKDSSLQALINQEQSLARDRLRQKIGREPTQEEVDKWLSEQTEGY